MARIGYGTIVFVVPQSSRAQSVKDFVALAKVSPGKLTFASPYKGTTQLLPDLLDLLDGRIDMALDSLPAYLPHLKAGRVRALAVASRARSSLMPELPTMAEAGVPGVVSATDYALFAPAAAPREVVTRLNREVNAVLELPDLRARLATQGIEAVGGTPESLQAELAEELAKWGRVIREANVKLE